MKLEHFAIDVPDAEAFVKWWCENLGFRPSAVGSGFIMDDTGTMGIEVYRTSETPSAPDYASMHAMTFHIALVSEDVLADVNRLVAAGAKLESLKQDNPAFHMALLRDPWGVTIQLCRREKSIFLA